MKINKHKLKQILKEEVSNPNSALAAAIGALAQKIDNLDVSIDYLAGAVTGESPASLGYAQNALGRFARPVQKQAPFNRPDQMNEIEQIIKEEISAFLGEASLEDLESRIAAMDARRTTDTKKARHRAARDDLNEIARALELMFQVTAAVKQKGTESFPRPGSRDGYPTPYGLSARDQPALKELADIVRQYAKQVKDAEVEPVNESNYNEATENLEAINKRVEHILGKINDLPAEMVDTSTRGGPSEAMAVDAYIGGANNYDEVRKTLRQHAYFFDAAVSVIARDRLVPDALTDRLASDVASGFLSRMWGL